MIIDDVWDHEASKENKKRNSSVKITPLSKDNDKILKEKSRNKIHITSSSSSSDDDEEQSSPITKRNKMKQKKEITKKNEESIDSDICFSLPTQINLDKNEEQMDCEITDKRSSRRVSYDDDDDDDDDFIIEISNKKSSDSKKPKIQPKLTNISNKKNSNNKPQSSSILEKAVELFMDIPDNDHDDDENRRNSKEKIKTEEENRPTTSKSAIARDSKVKTFKKIKTFEDSSENSDCTSFVIENFKKDETRKSLVKKSIKSQPNKQMSSDESENELLKLPKKRIMWTDKETLYLVYGSEKLGRQWSQIHEMFKSKFQNRSSHDLKDRYRNLERNQIRLKEYKETVKLLQSKIASQIEKKKTITPKKKTNKVHVSSDEE
jgi:hypothetical protein